MRVTVDRRRIHGECETCGTPIDGIALTVTVPTRGSASFCEKCGEGALQEFQDEERFRSDLRAKLLADGRPDSAAEAESLVLDLSRLSAH